MQTLGVLSDSHIRPGGGGLPRAVFAAFAGVDRIVHCGDITCLQVIAELSALAPVVAVHGNMDPYETAIALPPRRVFRLGGYAIGVTHGAGSRDALKNAGKDFRDSRLDLVLYGHSHCPGETRRGDTLYFNPGSPTRPRSTERGTVGIVRLGETIRCQILSLEEER